MAEQTGILTTNGRVAEAPSLRPAPAPRPAAGSGGDLSTARRTFRVLTANVQSVPRTAITLAQAREDLRANAADGDLVLLQEIDQRYRRLMLEAFPSTEWHVYFGPADNHSPIAARKDTFDLLDEQTVLIHPVRAGLHGRRYLTHVHLRHRELDVELHATNVHLTPGAFSKPPPADAPGRQAEWREGMRRHDRFVEGLVATGAPVVGGGDYNRQLRSFRADAATLAGRSVTFAVDTASIDLLWFIDGAVTTWSERGRAIFRGREGRPRKRNSDHAARQATLALSTAVVSPGPTPARTDPQIAKPGKKARRKHDKAPGVKRGGTGTRGPRNDASSFAPGAQAGPGVASPAQGPPAAAGIPFAGPRDTPFALTAFGDVNPKRVDWKTRAALEEVERRLGYRLTVVQGSYNGGKVKASGGTHDGGGVVDLLAWDWRRKVTALRAVGFAAWHRPARPGLWGEHIHAVLIDHGNLSASARAQVVAYRAGRDGLVGNRVDDFPRPRPIPVFSYPPAPVVAATPDGRRPRPGGEVAPLGSAFPPRRTLDGVDISHHQSGRLDLAAARSAGLRWLYVKATEGTTVKDGLHRRRVRQARAAGLPVGAYHFARPDGRDAAAEARFFLTNIELRAGDMVPMLDLEDTGDLSLAELTTWTGVWVRTVTQELRRRKLAGRPVIYTPFDLQKGFGCLLWVARYSDDFRPPVIPRPWRRAAIWQHSNGRFGPVKTVPGLGHVDVNALHPELPLSALRLRPVGRPARRAPGRPPNVDAVPSPAAPLEVVPPPVDATPVDATPVDATPEPPAPDLPPPALPPPGLSAPAATVVQQVAGDPGSIVITVTLPLPATPAPVVLSPDLGPLEEQLTQAAHSIQGAIDSLPERSGP